MRRSRPVYPAELTFLCQFCVDYMILRGIPCQDFPLLVIVIDFVKVNQVAQSNITEKYSVDLKN